MMKIHTVCFFRELWQTGSQEARPRKPDAHGNGPKAKEDNPGPNYSYHMGICETR